MGFSSHFLTAALKLGAMTECDRAILILCAVFEPGPFDNFHCASIDLVLYMLPSHYSNLVGDDIFCSSCDLLRLHTPWQVPSHSS